VKYLRLVPLLVLAAGHSVYGQHADSIESSRPKVYRVVTTFMAPAVLITSGLLVKPRNESIQHFFRRPEGEEQNPPASEHTADYTQFAPIVLAYGLKFAGNHGEHTVLKGTSMLLQAEALMIAMVRPLKYFTNEIRPDGGSHSFPSGHTAQAFLAATFLHKEFGHKSAWYSVAGYTMATAVGTCRMISNRHWASDVLVGAGLGILSTNLVYFGHKHRRKYAGRMNIAAAPTGFYFSMKL
jgi:hypothetical protein